MSEYEGAKPGRMPDEDSGLRLIGFAAGFCLRFMGLIAGLVLVVAVVGVDTRVKELVVHYHDRLRELNALPGEGSIRTSKHYLTGDTL